MKTIVWMAAVLCAGAVPRVCSAVDNTKSDGRACVAIMNVLNGDEEVLRAASTAGKNQKLVAHLDATAPCEVLVVPFLKTGRMVERWLPEYLELSAGREALAPKTPVLWSWENENGPVEIYVVFYARASNAGKEMRELVNAMRKTRDSGLERLQASKLRELIGRSNFDRQAALRGPRPRPSSEVAGVMRMVVGFEWRDSARTVNFSAEKPGVLIFPAADSR